MKFSFIILFSLLITACSSNNRIRIATSANMQFALEDLISEFKKNHDTEFDLVIGSSGSLYAQIKNGAPFDLFIAANMKYPSEVAKLDLADQPPKVYAKGQLILWTIKDFEPSLDLLLSDKVHKIGIANPETAPYGKTAIEALKNHGIYEQIKPKLVYGENISQTNIFISSGSVDIGLTSKSVLATPNLKSKGNFKAIDSKLYSNLEQGVVLLKNASDNEIAREFYTFLNTKEAKKILLKHGYIIE